MASDIELDPHSRPESSSDSMLADRYRLGDIVGRGSMGTVHRAVDVVLERPVAVKLFPPHSTDPEAARRYEQEARLLAGLSHPGLVTVFDAGIDRALARPYLVMELVDGPTLAEHITASPMPLDFVAAVSGQIAGALSYIHRRGVIHRDIKPANILLAEADDHQRGPAAKLTDFGIARLIDGARITMTGFTLGTANYLSPEQLSGGAVGAPSDVYSLGLVLLECLTGTVAYPGHGAEAAMKRLVAAPAIPPTVPGDWAQLVRAMTEPDPGARPDAADVANAVSLLAIGSPAPARADELAAAQATTVLATVPDPAAGGRPAGWAASGPPPAGSGTLLLPTTTTPASRVRRLGPALIRWLTGLAILGTAAIVIAVIVIAQGSGSAAKRRPTPTYPSVSGQLGRDLQQLQKAVTP